MNDTEIKVVEVEVKSAEYGWVFYVPSLNVYGAVHMLKSDREVEIFNRLNICSEVRKKLGNTLSGEPYRIKLVTDRWNG
jgi:hypothetical protein